MTKYELTLSPDYVSTWKLTDAVREVLQNAIDQEVTQEDNKMTILFEANKLTISNKHSSLEAKSLLMGSTSKANDPDTIGQHGEGYKVAALVLLRLGKTFTIYNHAKKEVWHTRFINSRKFGAKVLAFEIEKVPFWSSTPADALSIVITGLDEAEQAAIVHSNLHCQRMLNLGPTDVVSTTKGDIIGDERYKGQIYVSGLFVCEQEGLEYGYDIKPKWLQLGRDRQMVRTIDILWLTSEMWNETRSPLIPSMVKRETADVKYLHNTVNSWTGIAKEIVSQAHKEFVEEHGVLAMPVSNQSELYEAKSNFPDREPVIVSDSYKKLVLSSSDYVAPEKTIVEDEADMSLQDRFYKWLEDYGDDLEQDANEALTNLILEVE